MMRFYDSTPEAALPKGVKDFLPLKAAKGEYLQQQLRRVFAAWGFRPVVPPQLEFLDELDKGLGEELRERTFRFDDRQLCDFVGVFTVMREHVVVGIHATDFWHGVHAGVVKRDETCRVCLER